MAAPAPQQAPCLTLALPQEHPWAVRAIKIVAVVARLVAVASPQRQIAFGSAAHGALEAAMIWTC